jgi:hypothetical protein
MELIRGLLTAASQSRAQRQSIKCYQRFDSSPSELGNAMGNEIAEMLLKPTDTPNVRTDYATAAQGFDPAFRDAGLI